MSSTDSGAETLARGTAGQMVPDARRESGRPVVAGLPQAATVRGAVAPEQSSPDRLTRRRFDRGMALAGLLSVFVLGPLTYPGYFYTHRGMFVAYELVGLAVRPVINWLPTIAGDPTLTQGPVPYWLARLLLYTGLLPTGAVKWVIGFSLVSLAVGTYVVARRVAGFDRRSGPVDWAALAAAATVISAPFVIGLVYVRGEFSEVWALGLLPWALWAGLASVRVGPNREAHADVTAVVAGAILWTAVGLGHLGILVAGLVLLAVLRPSRQGWAGPVAGALLAAASWTLLVSRNPVRWWSDGIAPIDPSQLFSPVWTDALTPRDGLPIAVGPVAALGLILAIAPLGVRRPVGLSLFAGGAMVMLLWPVATVWSKLPALFAQPYDLLGPAVLALALIVAIVVRRFGIDRPAAGGAVIILALASTFGNLAFQPVVPKEPAFFNPTVVDRDIVLLETSLEDLDPRPGGDLTVALVWQTRGPVNRDLTVFTQLLDQAGQLVGQHDGPPVDGRRPTSGWKVGETFLDRHRIQFKPDLNPGRYQLVTGMYEPANGRRVDARRGGQVTDQVVIGEIEIR